jgi:hypothetical protein
MTDKKKTLLNESTVRRFMALAGVESLVNPFLDKVHEAFDSPDVPMEEGEELEEEVQASFDVGTEEPSPPPARDPDTPTDLPQGLEEGEELEEASMTQADYDKIHGKDAAAKAQAAHKKKTGSEYASGYIPPEKKKKEKPPRSISMHDYQKRVRAAPRTTDDADVSESPTSRTLAESILRHIPNLEIVDDESTFKTARQSDILQEVLRRVKEKLS